MMLARRALLLGAAGALAGCATGGSVSGVYKTANAFNVNLGREWSDITFMLQPRPRNLRLLSVDGPLLNRLYLAALEPGDSMLRPRDRDTPRPTFRTDMSDTEIVEFIVDCAAQEYQSPEATALRPQTFAGAPGVRFDLSAHTAEGLHMSGTALAARDGERLRIMLYLAPTEHYYAALLPEVERIFASATAA